MSKAKPANALILLSICTRHYQRGVDMKFDASGHTAISPRPTACEIVTQQSEHYPNAPAAQMTNGVNHAALRANSHNGYGRNQVPHYSYIPCRLRECTCNMTLNTHSTFSTVPRKTNSSSSSSMSC